MKIKYILIIIIVFIALGLLFFWGYTKSFPKTTPTTPDLAKTQGVFKMLVIDSQVGEPYFSARIAMFKELESLGYKEGKNLYIKYYTIGNELEKGKEILSSELENGYDVIFVNGTIMTVAAKEIAYGMKQNFIFAAVTDPVGVGVINSFEEPPSANFTGVSYPVPVKARLNFVKQLIPDLKTIGMIYADMPQSLSYRRWLEDLLENDLDFKDIKIIFRSIPFQIGEGGSQKMSEMSRPIIKELNPVVDVFLSPNDQMGVQFYFPMVVYEEATKPLCGLGKSDVMEGWGAAMSIFPSHEGMGKQVAHMAAKLFEGVPISEIFPEEPAESGIAFDLTKTEEFGITIPSSLIKLAGENFVSATD